MPRDKRQCERTQTHEALIVQLALLCVVLCSGSSCRMNRLSVRGQYTD